MARCTGTDFYDYVSSCDSACRMHDHVAWNDGCVRFCREPISTAAAAASCSLIVAGLLALLLLLLLAGLLAPCQAAPMRGCQTCSGDRSLIYIYIYIFIYCYHYYHYYYYHYYHYYYYHHYLPVSSRSLRVVPVWGPRRPSPCRESKAVLRSERVSELMSWICSHLQQIAGAS